MKKLKSVIRVIRSYLPSRLPQTGMAMEAWVVDVLALAKVPDNDSFRQAIASELMNLDGLINKKAKQYFVKVIQKRIVNQLAYQIIEGIREKEKQQREQST